MRLLGKYCTFPARSGKRPRAREPAVCFWTDSRDFVNVLAQQLEPPGYAAHNAMLAPHTAAQHDLSKFA
jgi:hypothetical protein